MSHRVILLLSDNKLCLSFGPDGDLRTHIRRPRYEIWEGVLAVQEGFERKIIARLKTSA